MLPNQRIKHLFTFLICCLAGSMLSAQQERPQQPRQEKGKAPGFIKIGVQIQQKGKEYFLVDPYGKTLHEEPFDYISKTNQGQGFYLKRKDQFGYADAKGKVIIPVQYKKLKYWSPEGMLAYREDDLCGVLSFENEVIIPFEYESLLNRIGHHAILAQKGGKAGVIDHNNQVIIPFSYDELLLQQNSTFLARKEGLTGFIDIDNQLVLPLKFANAAFLDEALFLIKQGGAWGIIDSKEQIQVACTYDSLAALSEGFVCTFSGKKRGVIDGAGNTIIPTEYERFNIDYQNQRVLAQKDGQTQLYDLRGRALGKVYDSISRQSLRKGQEPLYLIKKDGLMGILDTLGEERLPTEFNTIYSKYPGYYLLEQKGLFGIGGLDGRLLVPPIYYLIDFSGHTRKKMHSGPYIVPDVSDEIAIGRKSGGGTLYLFDSKGKAHEVLKKN